VPDQDHVVQVLVVEDRDDVADVQVEVDLRGQQVRPLAEARQRRAVHLVARGPEEAGDPLVAPAAVPAAVHQDVGRHRVPFPRSSTLTSTPRFDVK
jgi:hypothetical protein